MRIEALSACRGGWPMLLRQRDAFKMIAAGAFCESARGQKDCKPAQHTGRSGNLSADRRRRREMLFG